MKDALFGSALNAVIDAYGEEAQILLRKLLIPLTQESEKADRQ